MHILVIAQLLPPDMGGVSTRAYNAAKGLLLNGCKVTVVTAFHARSGENGCVVYACSFFFATLCASVGAWC